MRSNTTICLSFGRDEVELLTLLDEGRKKDYLSRSAWFKNKIREQYGRKETFKQFRDDVRKRKVRDEVSGMLQNHPSQGQQQVPQQKELVLEEALRFYYQNREQKRWRKE